MTHYLKVAKKLVYEDAVQFRHDLPKSWNLCKTFVGAKWSQTRTAGFVNTAYVETPEGRTALVDGDYIVHGLNKGAFFVLSEVQFHESYDIIASMRKWEPKKGILDEVYPTDLLKIMLPTHRTATFNDDRVDAFTSAIDISKKLVSPMDHILSDLRSQAATLHGEKVRKNDKTETDG